MGSGASKQRRIDAAPTETLVKPAASASRPVTPQAAGDARGATTADGGATTADGEKAEGPEDTARQSTQEDAIQAVVDKIWKDYDSDQNGHLDREEVFQFLQAWLGSQDNSLTEETVRHVFDEFDTDSSNTFDKKEMLAFLQRVYKSES